MRKMGKVAMALLVAVLALSMMACNPSGGQTVPESVGQGVVDAQYAYGYQSLLSLLNTFAGLNVDDYPVDETKDFKVAGTNLGTVTAKSYSEDGGYVYDAVFTAGSHSGLLFSLDLDPNSVNLTITKKADVAAPYYSADVNGGTKLEVTALGSKTLMNLQYDTAIKEDGSVTVADRTYGADKAAAYKTLNETLKYVIGILPADIANVTDTIVGTDFVKDETVTAENTVGYTGTSGDYEVAVTAVFADGAWTYKTITVDGTAFSDSIVAKINNPDVPDFSVSL